jgi:excisionase family DNA binding protein
MGKHESLPGPLGGCREEAAVPRGPRKTGRDGVAQPIFEPLLTVHEAAEFARVSKRTLYSLVESRRIPYLRIGAQIRFDRRALIAYMESSP